MIAGDFDLKALLQGNCVLFKVVLTTLDNQLFGLGTLCSPSGLAIA